MSETDTQETLENAAVTEESIESMAEEMLGQAGVQEDAAASALADEMLAGSGSAGDAHVEVFRDSGAVEAVPLKDIQLPNTQELRRILKVQVPIIVRLAEKIVPLGEIMQLVPGAIIEFNKEVGKELDLMINNKCVGSGQAVKVGEKFGLRVMNLESLEQVIKAMGGK